MTKASWGGGGWGSWHVGPEAGMPCPQGDGNHTVAEALSLNAEARARSLARQREAHERWLGKDPTPDPSEA